MHPLTHSLTVRRTSLGPFSRLGIVAWQQRRIQSTRAFATCCKNSTTMVRESIVVSFKAALYMLNQVEAGVCCPLSMTHSGYPVLHRYLHCTSDSIVDSFPLDKVLSRKYDQRCSPATVKSGLTLGKIDELRFSLHDTCAYLFPRNGTDREAGWQRCSSEQHESVS